MKTSNRSNFDFCAPLIILVFALFTVGLSSCGNHKAIGELHAEAHRVSHYINGTQVNVDSVYIDFSGDCFTPGYKIKLQYVNLPGFTEPEWVKKNNVAVEITINSFGQFKYTDELPCALSPSGITPQPVPNYPKVMVVAIDQQTIDNYNGKINNPATFIDGNQWVCPNWASTTHPI